MSDPRPAASPGGATGAKARNHALNQALGVTRDATRDELELAGMAHPIQRIGSHLQAYAAVPGDTAPPRYYFGVDAVRTGVVAPPVEGQRAPDIVLNLRAPATRYDLGALTDGARHDRLAPNESGLSYPTVVRLRSIYQIPGRVPPPTPAPTGGGDQTAWPGDRALTILDSGGLRAATAGRPGEDWAPLWGCRARVSAYAAACAALVRAGLAADAARWPAAPEMAAAAAPDDLAVRVLAEYEDGTDPTAPDDSDPITPGQPAPYLVRGVAASNPVGLANPHMRREQALARSVRQAKRAQDVWRELRAAYGESARPVGSTAAHTRKHLGRMLAVAVAASPPAETTPWERELLLRN
jgi:hypothetical protein